MVVLLVVLFMCVIIMTLNVCFVVLLVVLFVCVIIMALNVCFVVLLVVLFVCVILMTLYFTPKRSKDVIYQSTCIFDRVKSRESILYFFSSLQKGSLTYITIN